jgi:hypothetical protein
LDSLAEIFGFTSLVVPLILPTMWLFKLNFSKELKQLVVDVKVKRGVEIGRYHHLILMKMDENER